MSTTQRIQSPPWINYQEQGRWNDVHVTYIHIVEPFVDLFELAVMSHISINLERAVEIV
jgi:hypothetical protein